MQTSAIAFSVGGLHTWCLSFATDFSGMDMTSFAMDRVLLGDIGLGAAVGL